MKTKTIRLTAVVCNALAVAALFYAAWLIHPGALWVAIALTLTACGGALMKEGAKRGKRDAYHAAFDTPARRAMLASDRRAAEREARDLVAGANREGRVTH